MKQAEAPAQHAIRREQCITPWLVRGCAPHPGGDFRWFSARLIINALWCLDRYLACVLSQDFDTPLSVLLALKNYYSNHQLTSGLWSQLEDHFRWITSTLADMVPVRVVTRVSVSPADLDHSLPWPSFPYVTASVSTMVPHSRTYDSGSNVVRYSTGVQVRGCYSLGGG